MEISINDNNGYRSISADESYTVQQYGFYYNAEQHTTVIIKGETWINCTVMDSIGTYMESEYIGIQGESNNYRTVSSVFIDHISRWRKYTCYLVN